MYQQQISRSVAKPVQVVKQLPPQPEQAGESDATAAIVVGVVFGLVIAAVAGVLLRRKTARRPGRAAFEDLAGLLRLSRTEREIVREMAVAGGVVEPVALLVSAEKMREAAQAYLRIAVGPHTSTQAQRVLSKVHGN